MRSGAGASGSVAVLINRAHPFTDLVLTVDAFEDRLLGASTGSEHWPRFCMAVTAASGSSAWALSFFERLWQYDQVVFDASASA